MAGRKNPNIDVGNVTKKRDRESFKNFVLDIVKDTFIYEFTPTAFSLSGELFTLVLGPVDNSSPTDGDFTDYGDVKGYRFVYEDLVVDNVQDYIDVYLYGVKQSKDRYNVNLYNASNERLTVAQNARGAVKIEIVFTESITRRPAEVPISAFQIKGKIVEIE
jgi:hypothetical protein